MTKPEDETNEGEEKKPQQIIMLGGSDSDIRTVAVYGDVTEELAKEVVSGIWYLRATAKTEEPVDIEDPETDFEEVIRPLEMVISTNGGNADDMFAIYDAMRICREEVEIETLGIGKVMSAGVLLLAAGTKGKRKIGKHCRIMMHSVIGGHVGPMHQLDNEMKEIKVIQELHIKALCEETNMTEKQLRALLKKKVNIYLTAEEAVKHGIADVIV
jgi:ATP-dependent Clp endopeptidase proteolytic subunit ClpP